MFLSQRVSDDPKPSSVLKCYAYGVPNHTGKAVIYNANHVGPGGDGKCAMLSGERTLKWQETVSYYASNLGDAVVTCTFQDLASVIQAHFPHLFRLFSSPMV